MQLINGLCMCAGLCEDNIDFLKVPHHPVAIAF
jgi:hypothetical protein